MALLNIPGSAAIINLWRLIAGAMTGDGTALNVITEPKNAVSGSIWFTSTAITPAPATGVFATALAANAAASAISAGEVTVGNSKIFHWMSIESPVAITVEWFSGVVSQGKELVAASDFASFERTYDSFKITTTTGLVAGQLIQIAGGS